MKYQGSSVTRVPMESSPLVKEILTEKEEYCVGSRKSSSVVVSKKRRLPFRHVQQKTIPRLLTTVPVYLLKFRWHLWDLVWLFSGFQFLVATSKTGRSSVLFKPPTFLGYSVMWDRFALMMIQIMHSTALESLLWIVVGHDAIVCSQLQWITSTRHIIFPRKLLFIQIQPRA